VDEAIREEALANLEDYGLDGEDLPEEATAPQVSAWGAKIATGLLEDAEATVGSWPEEVLQAVADHAREFICNHARVDSEEQRELALELLDQAPLESWRDKFSDAKQAGLQMALKLVASARKRLDVARELKADRLESLEEKAKANLHNLTEAASPDLRIAAEELITEEELERWEVRFNDLEDAASKLARWALEKAEPQESKADDQVDARLRATAIRRQVNAQIAKRANHDKEGQLARAALEKMGDIKLTEFEGSPEGLGESMADELIRQAREKIAANPEKLETERAAKAAQAAQAARKARDADKGDAAGEDGQERKPTALVNNGPDYSEDAQWKSLRQGLASSLGHAEVDDSGEKLTDTERTQFYEAICKRRGVDALVEIAPDAFEEEVEALKETATKSVAGGLSQRAAYVRRTINEHLDV